MKINEIIIKGIDQSSKVREKDTDSLFDLKHSFRVGAAVRGKKVPSKPITLDDKTVIEFVLDDDSIWLSNWDTIGDIIPEADKPATRGGKTTFTIPSEITYPATDRGSADRVILKGVNILSRKVANVSIKKLARNVEDKQTQKKIGLFRLKPDFQLQDYNGEIDENPFCLFIHGTGTSISAAFGDIRNTDLMRFLEEEYVDRILAFQHRSLTDNPIGNVKNLVKQLPQKCTLHLITMSRGGLVGEVLSRFCNSVGGVKGFTQDELDVLEKEYPKKYFDTILSDIKEIKKELAVKEITIEKFIRVACPAAGTTLASKRLDIYFNTTLNLIGLTTGMGANPVYRAFKNLSKAFIGTKSNVYVLPGIEAQRPASPFIKAINGLGIANRTKIDNSLVVIAGNSKVGFKLGALLVILSKLFYRRKNDLVVDTIYMSLGTERKGKVHQFLYEDKDIHHLKYFENKITRDALIEALANKWGDTLPEFTTNPVIGFDRSGFDMTDKEINNPYLELEPKKATISVSSPPIRISVTNGDLSYAKYPILAGHFEDDSILYAEKQIDNTLESVLTKFQKLGYYPGKIAESRMFLTNRKGFQGAVIVGLGRLEVLTPAELSRTVEMGVANYLFNLQHKDLLIHNSVKEKDGLGISSLIIGCGYGGLAIESSVRAIIQGVHNANVRIKELDSGSKLVIRHIEFVELFEDKAANCLFSIDQIENDESNSFKISKEGRGFHVGPGFRVRIPLDNTQEWWNRITVTRGNEEEEVPRELKFSTSTRSASEKEQPLFTTPSLIEDTLNEISTNNRWTNKRARTIFEMLIPNDFKDELKRHGNIIWVLDTYTATYPWELLQDGSKATEPISVSSGMIRKLKTGNYRKTVKAVSKNSALVVADPQLDGFLNQLEGAYKEGEKVIELLSKKEMTVTESFNENHSDIIEKLFGDEYKILHLSGHGVFSRDDPYKSGMLIGKDKYLSTREIQQMSSVPELVFVNCCHLGKTDGVAEEYYQQRFKLAANIGTQLIMNGVRCVIAAGWAVNDHAALEFAEVFYRELIIEGNTFGEAVKEARRSLYIKYNWTNTWGAYQAYGDPYYRFRESEKDKKEKRYLLAQQAEVDLINLKNAIEMVDPAAETVEKYDDQLATITKAVDSAKIENYKIDELVTLIKEKLNDKKKQ